MSLTVKKIKRKSPAKNAGIKKYYIVHRINDIDMCDFIDDIYSNTLLNPIVDIERNGEYISKKLSKSQYEDIGLVFAEELYPDEKSCTNKCVFCFVDQLPQGMRTSLYVKDDDWRYSVLYGNYITMTNMTNDDFFRIASRKVSPLYISVHATDKDVRVKLLNNKKASKIMEQLEFLYEKKITYHCQVVLCPGINDKKVLEKTMKDLAKLYPYAKSLSVVPVGLTKHRQGLAKIKSVDKIYAKKTIQLIENYREKFVAELGTPFVYIADEFYSKAEIDYPLYINEDISAQKANGIGLFSDFIEEFKLALDELEGYDARNRKVALATGVSAYSEINKLCKQLEDKVENIKMEVIKTINNYFGDSITVAGLLTGNDIIKAVGINNIDALFIPSSALKANENIFLDDMSINDLENELKTCVIISPNDGYDFAMAVSGRVKS